MRLVALDRPPLVVIGAAVEPGQDHRTVVECRHHGQQLGHRWNATGEPGGDDRVARRRATPGRGLMIEQTVAPHSRVERALGGEDVRPPARQDLEKLVNDPPMRGEILRNEVCEPREIGTLGRHGVEKASEAGGQSGRLPRQ